MWEWLLKELKELLDSNRVVREFSKIDWTGINTEEEIKRLMKKKRIKYKFFYDDASYCSFHGSCVAKFQMENGKCITRGMQT